MFAKLYSENNDSDPNRCTLKSYSQQRGSKVSKISYSYSLFVTTITSHSDEVPFGKQVWFILDTHSLSRLIWTTSFSKTQTCLVWEWSLFKLHCWTCLHNFPKVVWWHSPNGGWGWCMKDTLSVNHPLPPQSLSEIQWLQTCKVVLTSIPSAALGKWWENRSICGGELTPTEPTTCSSIHPGRRWQMQGWEVCAQWVWLLRVRLATSVCRLSTTPFPCPHSQSGCY